MAGPLLNAVGPVARDNDSDFLVRGGREPKLDDTGCDDLGVQVRSSRLSFADAYGGGYNLCGDFKLDPLQDVDAVSRSRSGKSA